MQLITYRINPAFKKQIYTKLINPWTLRHTIRIINDKLVFHVDDIEFVSDVLDRNNLPYKTI